MTGIVYSVGQFHQGAVFRKDKQMNMLRFFITILFFSSFSGVYCMKTLVLSNSSSTTTPSSSVASVFRGDQLPIVQGNKFKIWDTKQKKYIYEYKDDQPISHVCPFNKNDNRFVTVRSNGLSGIIHDIRKKNKKSFPQKGNSFAFAMQNKKKKNSSRKCWSSVDVSPDDLNILTLAIGGKIARIFSVEKRMLIKKIAVSQPISCPGYFMPDGKILIGLNNGIVGKWNTDGTCELTFGHAGKIPVIAVGHNWDGKKIFVAKENKLSSKAFNASNGKQVKRYKLLQEYRNSKGKTTIGEFLVNFVHLPNNDTLTVIKFNGQYFLQQGNKTVSIWDGGKKTFDSDDANEYNIRLASTNGKQVVLVEGSTCKLLVLRDYLQNNQPPRQDKNNGSVIKEGKVTEGSGSGFTNSMRFDDADSSNTDSSDEESDTDDGTGVFPRNSIKESGQSSSSTIKPNNASNPTTDDDNNEEYSFCSSFSESESEKKTSWFNWLFGPATAVVFATMLVYLTYNYGELKMLFNTPLSLFD